MFFGLIIALDLPLLKSLPVSLRKAAGWIVLAAGLWNSLWYGIQNISEFWGYSALVSGGPAKLPKFLTNSKPVVLVLLAGYAVLYATSIARL
jgi:hypothetical protein